MPVSPEINQTPHYSFEVLNELYLAYDEELRPHRNVLAIHHATALPFNNVVDGMLTNDYGANVRVPSPEEVAHAEEATSEIEGRARAHFDLPEEITFFDFAEAIRAVRLYKKYHTEGGGPPSQRHVLPSIWGPTTMEHFLRTTHHISRITGETYATWITMLQTESAKISIGTDIDEVVTRGRIAEDAALTILESYEHVSDEEKEEIRAELARKYPEPQPN